MSTLSDFCTQMAEQGYLLPPALVNDHNRGEQDQELAALAALAALARSLDTSTDLHDTAAIFAVLDDAFQVQAAGVFSFEELLGYYKGAHAARIKALSPSEFPMPAAHTLPGVDMAALDAAQAARYQIAASSLDGSLSSDQQAAAAELVEAATARARVMRPERVGTQKADHEEPFPIGLPPTDEEPDLSTLPR